MILEIMMIQYGHYKEYMIIYQATNKINGKYYIGKTIRTLKERKWRHYYDTFKKESQCYFHRAIRKYGKENFEWKVICKCNNEKELNETEIYYIKKLNSSEENGYNLTQGGDGFASGDLNHNRINPMFGERNPFYGKHHTEETKKILREQRIGKNMGDENSMIIHNIDFNGNKNPFYDKHHTEKSKNQISNTKSNMWCIITPSGKEFTFRGLSRFCKENKLNYSGVKGAVRNKRKYKDGWFFKKLTLKGI